MTTIYIAYGLPCTGKSTFSKTLSNTGIVSSDDLISLLGKAYGIDSYNEAFNVFAGVGSSRVLKEMAKLYISRGQDVFYDRTNLNTKSRAPMVNLAKDLEAKLVGIHFKPSATKYAELVKSRPEKYVSPNFFNPDTFEDMTYEEGFHAIYNFNYDSNIIELI